MQLLFALAGLCLATSLHAAEDGPAPAAVRYFAANCFNCHGSEGRAAGAIPAIAGRDREFLRESLLAFKAGSKPASIMQQLAKGYSNRELVALADYFSRQPQGASHAAAE